MEATAMNTNDERLMGEVTAPRQGTSAVRKKVWAGRILSALAVLFLLMDAGMKLLKVPLAVQGTVDIGYPASTVFGIGLVLLACVAVYAIPRTAVLGAVLLTGYLGGAIATHVRVGNPLFSHVLFPIYVAVLIWGALYLRDSRVRALLLPPSRHA